MSEESRRSHVHVGAVPRVAPRALPAWRIDWRRSNRSEPSSDDFSDSGRPAAWVSSSNVPRAPVTTQDVA